MFIRLIFLCAVIALGQQRLSYLFETEDQSIRHYWDMSSNDIAMTRGKEFQRIVYSKGGITKQFTYSDTLENIHYVAERNGSFIKLTGTYKGKPVTKEFEIDSNPWYQSVHDFSEFARNQQEEELIYWVIRPSDMKIVKMRALKEQSDMGYSSVVVTPVGIYAKFWRAHYSYRNSDGLFVKFRCKQRIPGGSETEISLLTEQYVSN